MKTNTKLMLAVTLSLLAMQPYNVFAANADDFMTNEYYGIGKNVFDLINATDAYVQGYTGKGVIVGVADYPVNFAHQEFSGKQNSSIVYDELNGDYGELTWHDLDHGTHVAGIVAANKDGVGMHGVAYDADIASSSMVSMFYGIGNDAGLNIFDYYLTKPDIKIINNSWGVNLYLTNIRNKIDFEDYITSYPYVDGIEKAVHTDKLLVFAAGNSGHLTASLESNLDVLYGDKAFNDNIITVTAAKANSFTKKEDGSLLAQSDAIAMFSELAMYNEDTTLSAPGMNINSANADFEAGEDYVKYNGTSMAAPVVSGVGALVQQAFPYLGGKQIGDVLLSTANKNIETEENYFITLQEDGWYYEDGSSAGQFLNFNIYFTGQIPENFDKWKTLYEYYKKHPDTFLYAMCGGDESKFDKVFGDIVDEDSFKEKLINSLKNYFFDENSITVYQNVPLDVIFGQGIVDAGKAVNGLGAINVRRLDSSDISSDYTVYDANKKESVQTKQALYTVDTQGYNSIWSNDISEIRAGYIAENPLTSASNVGENSGYDKTSEDFAGLTDLHDRWVFYTTNNFDESGDNWMTNYYMQQYNQQVAESGLAGLHAGLYKTSEGVLALTGNNTYKGASTAAGGTLQIDGSVAGDAYSEGKGTIAGSGTINGSLYNNGTVASGSWDAVRDKDGNALNLKVNGNFDGSGVIAVNTDGEKYAVINVGNTADVSQMSLKAGTFAAPEVSGTILTVGENGTLKGTEKLNTDFSGLLNSEVTESTGNKTLQITTSVNNNAGINGDRFTAINSLYDNLSKEEQQEMYRLYALDNNELRSEIQNISASEGMHLEMAHDAIQNRDVRQAAARQQHLDRDEGLWAISGKSWGEADGGITRHSFNMTLGRDFYNNDDSYLGAMFAYSDNSIGGYGADGEYDNYSFGLYGGTKNNPGTVTGYLSYGVQDNEMTRHLSGAFSYSGLSSKAESSYDSSVIGAGVKYAYDLDYGKEDIWHISPYAAMDYARKCIWRA